MGKQQTAGQIKGEWHSCRKEVVSAWPKLRKQTGYASLICRPHFRISHNHGACEWLWEILKRGQSLRWKGGWETTYVNAKNNPTLQLSPIFTSHILYPTSIDSTNFNNKATVTVWNESWLNNLCAFSIPYLEFLINTHLYNRSYCSLYLKNAYCFTFVKGKTIK